MITATVRYKLPPHIDYVECLEHFHKIAPGFRDVRGLIILSGMKAGGPGASTSGRTSMTPRHSTVGHGSTASWGATA